MLNTSIFKPITSPENLVFADLQWYKFSSFFSGVQMYSRTLWQPCWVWSEAWQAWNFQPVRAVKHCIIISSYLQSKSSSSDQKLVFVVMFALDLSMQTLPFYIFDVLSYFTLAFCYECSELPKCSEIFPNLQSDRKRPISKQELKKLHLIQENVGNWLICIWDRLGLSY